MMRPSVSLSSGGESTMTMSYSCLSCSMAALKRATDMSSPMSWGGWILVLVYPVLALGALRSLPGDWLASWPALARLAATLREPAATRTLSNASILTGIALGIYTGILLNTMVARPLWNSAILGPLFLVSGLSAGAAVMHIAAALLQGRSTPQGMVAGAVSALLQPLGAQHPHKSSAQSLLRYDQIFLVAELVFIALLLINLPPATSTEMALLREKPAGIRAALSHSIPFQRRISPKYAGRPCSWPSCQKISRKLLSASIAAQSEPSNSHN